MNTKERGITLIALVITIIVLLILAAVSIATLTGENGILSQAERSKTENVEGKERDEIALAYNGAKIVKNGGEITAEDLNKEFIKNSTKATASGSDPIEVTYSETYSETGNIYTIAENGQISIATPKDNYTDANRDKATVPNGFTVSDKDGETTIDSGLVVIAPDGSEFVWVPVPRVIANSEADAVDADKNKAMAVQNGTNYRGLLYEFTSSDSTVISGCTAETNTNGYREPDVLTGEMKGGSYLSTINKILGSSLSDFTGFKTQLQKDYNKMIESVKKYGGFYVGRYETSLNENNLVQSKKDVTSANAWSNKMWYGLYAKQKTYSTDSVQGSMIWGSQYEAMMHWMQKNDIDVSSSTPITVAVRNKTRVTGSEEKDKLNNIYDLLGNSREWTLTAYDRYCRVGRGGYYEGAYLLSSRGGIFPTGDTDYVSSYYGSRLTLYIK